MGSESCKESIKIELSLGSNSLRWRPLFFYLMTSFFWTLIITHPVLLVGMGALILEWRFVLKMPSKSIVKATKVLRQLLAKVRQLLDITPEMMPSLPVVAIFAKAKNAEIGNGG